MAKKKVSRKELLKKEDEFITFSARLLKFILEHKVQISTTLGVIIGLILIISLIRYISENAEAEAFTLLAQTMSKYEESLQEKEPDKAYLEVKSDFENILNKYPRKEGGNIARIVYANICYNGGDIDKSIELYNKAINNIGDHISLKNFILSGLAYAYEAKKEYESAIKYFERIAAGPGAVLKDEALFNLGRLYAETGKKEKSSEAFKKIVSDYEDSMYIEIAKQYGS